MNHRFLVLLISCSALMIPRSARADRQIVPLASDWKFIRENAGPSATSDHWQSVTIPHTWNALDGQGGGLEEMKPSTTQPSTTQPSTTQPGTTQPAPKTKGYYRGTCWYEKTLDIPAEWQGKRIFVHFEAASLVASVYLNGEPIGEHRGAFTAFCFELTRQLHYGKSNVLRVSVDNTHHEDIPPLSGDFNMNGGIYRPVQMIVTDDVCITPLDFATSGVYITTQSLSPDAATVVIKSLISNGGRAAARIAVEAEIKDAGGKSVATVRSDETFEPADASPVLQKLTFAHPHLWQGVSDPYQYSVSVRVIRDDHAIDEVVQPLGLRTVEISKEQGFLLNGHPYAIHGVNRHQDKRGKGWALTPEDEAADAQIMLDMGVTAVRLAHYPQSQSWHSLCDRLGILCWDEVSLVDQTSDTKAFWDNADQQARELAHQLNNHPCVAWWGLFNELENKPTPPSGPQLEEIRKIYEGIDPSRITVAASDHGNRYFNTIAKATAFNQYPGWYGKADATGLAGGIVARANEIGQRIALSEYGAGGNPQQHAEGILQRPEARGPFHPEEYQAYVHEKELEQIQNNPNLWGTFLWVMFDFPSAGRREGGTVGLNDKGMVTQDRKLKKDVYFLYQANWTTKPMVYIASRRMTVRKLATTEVKAYSNCAEVELKVNGESRGRVKPDAIRVCRWPAVKLKAGENKVEVLSTGEGGSSIADSCVLTVLAVE